MKLAMALALLSISTAAAAAPAAPPTHTVKLSDQQIRIIALYVKTYAGKGCDSSDDGVAYCDLSHAGHDLLRDLSNQLTPAPAAPPKKP